MREPMYRVQQTLAERNYDRLGNLINLKVQTTGVVIPTYVRTTIPILIRFYIISNHYRDSCNYIDSDDYCECEQIINTIKCKHLYLS